METDGKRKAQGGAQALAARLRSAAQQRLERTDRRVSRRIENVTVPELLEALLKPEGLTFRLRGRTLEIHAAE